MSFDTWNILIYYLKSTLLLPSIEDNFLSESQSDTFFTYADFREEYLLDAQRYSVSNYQVVDFSSIKNCITLNYNQQTLLPCNPGNSEETF